MQRVRTSLPYFAQFGWTPVVVAVDERYTDSTKDNLLMQSLPPDVEIHRVKALNQNITSKFGLGSLALRSMPYYLKKVNQLLKREHFDLIYFSTTQFMICALGAYWNKRFGVPYVIDMQDPWFTGRSEQRSAGQQQSKYHLAYTLHRWLEPVAMKRCGGLIGVSQSYIEALKHRYPAIKNIPSAIITFGAFAPDNDIANAHYNNFGTLLKPGFTNIVYIGRGGNDMHKALEPVFKALQTGMGKQPELFCKLKLYFIGTSYAPAGTGTPTILPLARKFGIEDQVVEITNRMPYYQTLVTMQQADALLIPGSDDPRYTASKIYPYLITQKPLIAVFNSASNSVTALRDSVENGNIFTFEEDTADIVQPIAHLLAIWASGQLTPVNLLPGFDNYSAKNLTSKQAELFERVSRH